MREVAMYGPEAAGVHARKARKTADRVDWSSIRDQLDMAQVVIALLGPAPGRRGSRGLWWCCPFHQDQNPSFCVTPGKPWWKCWGCGERGDAATLVMNLNHCTFPEAVAYLAGKPVPSSRAKATAGPLAAAPSPDRATIGHSLGRRPGSGGIVDRRLWAPEGVRALGYLRDRG